MENKLNLNTLLLIVGVFTLITGYLDWIIQTGKWMFTTYSTTKTYLALPIGGEY